MNVVRATPAECAAMAQAHAEAFEKAWREDEFEDLLDGAGIYGFLARADAPAPRTPFGVILCRVAAGEMEVLTLGVTPAARRRGVARALLAAALPPAVALGAAEVFLEVATDNDAAIALYEGLGFRKAGLRKAYYDRSPFGFADAYVMRLDLAAAASYPDAGLMGK